MRTRTVVPSVLVVASLLLAVISFAVGRDGAAAKYAGVAVVLVLALTIARSGALRADNRDLVLSTFACGAATVAMAVGFTRGLLNGHTGAGRMFLFAVGAACLAVPTGFGVWLLLTSGKQTERPDE